MESSAKIIFEAAENFGLNPQYQASFRTLVTNQLLAEHAKIFEFTIRGMGDHGLTVIEKTSALIRVRCACGDEFGPFATIAGIWRPWSAHVLEKTLIG
jgi:hypothetical protein